MPIKTSTYFLPLNYKRMISDNNINNKEVYNNFDSGESFEQEDSYDPVPSTYYKDSVKDCKNRLLKERLRTLIKHKKMSEADFFNSLGMSRQYWYAISWGIWDTPSHIKLKIAEALDCDTSEIWGGLE